MEVLGTALGVVGTVGVLGQIFTGCIRAYAFFTTAANLVRDSKRLVCKIRIEEMRLLVWGREWGVVEGKLEAHLQEETKAGNERLRPLAMQILEELYRTITDFNKLQDRYGLREMPPSPMGEMKDGQKKNNGAAGIISRLKTELHLRGKWVIEDKEKFMVLLSDLKDYNDGLERPFPSSRLATLQRTWQNELLQWAARDLGKLNLLETASSGVYPQLNASASLKQLRINLDSKPASAFRPTYSLKIERTSLTLSDRDPRRSVGGYQNPSINNSDVVIIEWVSYDRDDVEARVNHLRRIDDLARMIHSASNRYPDLHTVDCLGYTDDTASSRYGLVYKAPSQLFLTLNSLIMSNDHRTPDLGNRFRLAHTLAVALWSLHSLDWLHKSLSSNNILFFPTVGPVPSTRTTTKTATAADISSPFLLGFDCSRPDHQAEMSIALPNPSSMDLHRHPDSLNGIERKPYCKSYDIYSLGIMLLEIGLWKVLQTYHKADYSAAKFRDRVILQVLVPGLGSKTGSLYREVVERCLCAEQNLTSIEAGNLMEYVVGTLESLRV